MLLNGANLKSKMQLVLLFAFIFNSCGSQEVYDRLPKKSILTKEVLQKSSKIIRYRKDLLLEYSHQIRVNRHRGYLLFYNNKLELSGVCDSDAIRIENVRNDTVFGIINEHNPPRAMYPMCDLPKNYSRVLRSLELRSSNRIRNKVIDSIKLNFQNMEVELHMRKSINSLYDGFKNTKNPNFSKHFTKNEILKYKISDLYYDYRNQIITYEKISKSSVIQDEMIILEESIFDKFYEDLWDALVN